VCESEIQLYESVWMDGINVPELALII